MKPVMYIFLNEGANMSIGKAAAQASHAAVEAFQISKPEMIEAWYVGRHHTKLVMSARDQLHLYAIKTYLGDRGFKSYLIIDEGRTEIDAFTPTALGVEIVDKDDEHVAATFGDFRTLRPPKPEQKGKKLNWWHSRS